MITLKTMFEAAMKVANESFNDVIFNGIKEDVLSISVRGNPKDLRQITDNNFELINQYFLENDMNIYTKKHIYTVIPGEGKEFNRIYVFGFLRDPFNI